MIISSNQFEQLSTRVKENYIGKLIIGIRNNHEVWAENKDDVELKKIINDIIDLVEMYQIADVASIRQFIEYKINYPFDIPLNKQLDMLLRGDEQNKKKKVEFFFLSLRSESYKLIPVWLETDTENTSKT